MQLMAGRQANSAWRHYLFASAPAIIYWIFGGRFFPSLRTLVSARQTGSEWQGSIWQVCSRTAGSQPSGAERSVFLKAPANTLHEMKILDYTFPSSASLPLSCRALSLLAAASLLLANGEPLSGVYKHRELSCLAGGKPAASRPLAAFT